MQWSDYSRLAEAENNNKYIGKKSDGKNRTKSSDDGNLVGPFGGHRNKLEVAVLVSGLGAE